MKLNRKMKKQLKRMLHAKPWNEEEGSYKTWKHANTKKQMLLNEAGPKNIIVRLRYKMAQGTGKKSWRVFSKFCGLERKKLLASINN